MRPFFFYIIIAIISVPLTANSQRYLSHQYTESEGLVNSHVKDIVQDTAGRIWFATRIGVSVYDGSQWKSYGKFDGLNSIPIDKLEIDSNGQLWANGRSDGIHIYKFVNGKWETAYQNDSISHISRFNHFKIVINNGKADIYLASISDGLYIIKDDSLLIHKTKGENYNINEIKGIAFGHKNVYVATHNGLFLINKNNSDSIYEFDLNTSLSKKLNGIFTDHYLPNNCKIWLAGYDWVGFIQDGKFNLVNDQIDIKVNLVTDHLRFASDDKGGIYIGNPYDFYHVSSNGKNVTKLGPDNGLITSGITSLYRDRERNLWIGSLRGVTKIPTKRFANYDKQNGLFDSECSAIVEYSPGKFILGHYGALTVIDNNKIKYINYPQRDNYNPIEARSMDFEIDSRGNLWIATSYYGLLKLSKNGEFTTYWDSIPFGTNITTIVEIEPETFLLTTNNKLKTLKNNKFENFNYPEKNWYEKFAYNNENKISVRKIYRSNQKGLFFLTTYYHGLLSLKDGKWDKHFISATKDYNNIYSFLEASDSNIYIGTIGGLCVLKNNKIVKVNNDMSVSSPIYNLLEDNQKNIWIGTDIGVYKWDGKKLTHFTVNDGLAGPEINRDAMIVDSQGKIWIGTNHGVSIYNEYHDYNPEEIPPPLLELGSIIVDTDTLSSSEKHSLKYYQNNLTFSFLGISFIDENQIFYKCKLDGLDDKWSDEFRSYDNQYVYHNLPPGNYRFNIKARNALGKWSEAKEFPVIKINGPFYQQIWFAILTALFFITMTYLFIRFYAQKKYAQKLKVEVDEQTKDLRESEKKLKLSNTTKDRFFSIIAHDLKGPFNAILGYSDILSNEFYQYSDKEKKQFIENIRSASSSSYELLDNLLVWALSEEGNLKYSPVKFKLNPVIEDIINFLQSSANKKRIRIYNGIIEDIAIYADKNMISTVIRNIISNSIKFTQEKGRISITSQQISDKIEISIEDNGSGIDKNKLEKIFATKSPDEMNSSSGTGLGLILCKEFVSRNKGEIKVESKINEGSKFSFTVPANPPD